MLVNLESLQSLGTLLSAAYAEGLITADAAYEAIATVVPSNNKSNTYAWLGSVPTMRKWVGDRILKELSGHKYTLENQDYEATIAVDRNDIEDDSFGIYAPMASMLATEAKNHKARLVWELLDQGIVNLGYDGVPFFSTAHPVGSGTQSNFIDGAADPWYVLDTSKPLKPLIMQVRREPELVPLTKADDANVFFQKKYIWGVDGRYAAGYGFWQMAVRSEAALTEANLAAARALMRGFSDDSGVKLAMLPVTLVVGISNETAASKLINNLNLANGETNVNKGQYKLIVSPYLP